MINKPRLALVILCLSIFLIKSCSDAEKGGNVLSESRNYKLEIFDSLQFDMLTQGLVIADVDTKTGDMLVIQPYKSPKAWLFDNSYKVLAEFHRPDGDPEGTGKYIFTGSFFDDGIALMGHTTVNLYDREFNFKKRMNPNYGP